MPIWSSVKLAGSWRVWNIDSSLNISRLVIDRQIFLTFSLADTLPVVKRNVSKSGKQSVAFSQISLCNKCAEEAAGRDARKECKHVMLRSDERERLTHKVLWKNKFNVAINVREGKTESEVFETKIQINFSFAVLITRNV